MSAHEFLYLFAYTACQSQGLIELTWEDGKIVTNLTDKGHFVIANPFAARLLNKVLN